MHMLHVLRSFILVECVVIMMPLARLLFEQCRRRRWTFACRDGAAFLALFQVAVTEYILWSHPLAPWPFTALTAVWVTMLGIVLYARTHTAGDDPLKSFAWPLPTKQHRD